MSDEKSNGLKIFSLQENLKQGLALVGRVAGKNINLPILNNVLIKADEGKIRLVATNLEVGVISTVRGKIEQEGILREVRDRKHYEKPSERKRKRAKGKR